PSLRSIDEAIRRRFLLVPFTVKIPRKERDQHLAEKLTAEWPAILRWMVDGCAAWQRDGLMVPDVVRQATDEYFEAQDTVGQWLDECTIRELRAFTPTTRLFADWKVWCNQTNNYIGTERDFTDELVRRDFGRGRSEFARGHNGIALRKHRWAEDPADTS